MEYETHRRALRNALPWLFAALFPLLLSVALPTSLSPFVGASSAAWIERASTWLGAIGSGAMLLGLLQLSRARVSGGLVPSFVSGFLAWTAEFALRMFALSSSDELDTLLAARLIASSIAMLAVATGMAGVIARQGGRAHVGSWRRTQLMFAAFAALLAVALAFARTRTPELGLWSWIESLPLGAPLAWLAFATPWAALVLAVRRSVRWIARGQSVSDVLTG